jgi:hypothetical protein
MSKVYIVMAGYGSEGEGWWEDIVKVFTDETTAELYALELNELEEKYASSGYQDEEILKKIDGLDKKHVLSSSYSVQEHEVH